MSFKLPVVHVLLIEADNQRNLGGSCTRDLLNMDKYVSQFTTNTSIQRGQTCVLSIDNSSLLKSKFTTKNIIFDKLSNYKTVFNTFTNNVRAKDYVIILISGHGYQCPSRTSEEVDRMDEFISYGGGFILDNELFSLLVSKLYKTSKTVCLGDTCHAGTLFDIVNPPKVTNVFSISACLDNQLSSCDIGMNTGYGGSLTVHLLDMNNAIYTLLLGSPTDIKALTNKLASKLAMLRQKPLLSGI